MEPDFLKHGKKADIISQRVKALFAMQTWHAYKVRRRNEQGDPHDWPAKAKWKWLECFHLQALHRVLVNSIVWNLLWAIQSCLSNSRWIRIVLAVEGLNFRHHVLLEVYKTIEKAVAVLSSLCVCAYVCLPALCLAFKRLLISVNQGIAERRALLSSKKRIECCWDFLNVAMKVGKLLILLTP